MTQAFTEEQVQRYARHIILPNIGGAVFGPLNRLWGKRKVTKP